MLAPGQGGGEENQVTIAARRQAMVGALTAAVALAVGGCGARAGGPAGAPAADLTPADQRLVSAVTALCDARRQAATTVPTARTTFYDRAHDAMHELARRTETADRPAASQLLEAKNAVEQDFLHPRTWARLGGDLAGLDQAARAALGAIGVAAPAACPG
jgi:hypothetical protein